MPATATMRPPGVTTRGRSPRSVGGITSTAAARKVASVNGIDGVPSRAEMLQAADVADAVAWVVTRPAHVDIEELRLARS